ncbi:hypothetical protein BGX31_001589 [Mortierella sp. GBA43]|nr:hypothetical protein BGX31_001589 [Mortierella sp. GBA43]
MPVRGDHLEPVRTSTRDFAKYNTVFKKKLVALYKIVYKERYYISPRLKVPKKFANNKSIGRDFYPIFVCKARNLKCSKEDILFVQSDDVYLVRQVP